MTDKQIMRDYQDDEAMWRSADPLPVVTDDDGFFEAVDSFIIALRWPLLAFAVVAMSLFCTAMIIWLPFGK